ncbi:MAG: LLM class flavin-dependent oxidoreductase, partial [Gammaproteobacteria bacterium]
QPPVLPAPAARRHACAGGAAIGICLVHHGDALAPQVIAAAAEARGLDALYLPENSHVPVARPATPRRVADIERLACFYDPFVALAACAATTRHIRLGTSVCLLTQRDARATARSVASLMSLAGDRLVLGVAGGFIREAMENHGSPFATRWRVVRERVAAMRTEWAAPSAGAAGRAGPPVWIGSNSARVPARVAAWADGWMTRRELYPGDALADLRAACARAGRPFESLTVALMGAPLDATEACRAAVSGYGELVFTVGETTRDAILRRLDAVAALALQVRAA